MSLKACNRPAAGSLKQFLAGVKLAQGNGLGRARLPHTHMNRDCLLCTMFLDTLPTRHPLMSGLFPAPRPGEIIRVASFKNFHGKKKETDPLPFMTGLERV